MEEKNLEPHEFALAKKLITDFCESELMKYVDFVKERYNVPSVFDPELKLDFRKTRINCWGGVNNDGNPYLNLLTFSILSHVKTKKDIESIEYAFLKRDPDVYNLKGSWKTWVAMTLTHELAHAVVYWLESELDDDPSKIWLFNAFDPDIVRDKRAHGLFWQKIYKDLRREFVNGIDFDMEYTFDPKPWTPVRNLKCSTVAVWEDGGRTIEYFVSNQSVGKFFTRNKKLVQVWNPKMNRFEDTKHMKLVAAKKELFERLAMKG